MLIPILVAIIIISLLIVFIMLLLSLKAKHSKNPRDGGKPSYRKGKNVAIKDFEKKLAHDPHNVAALEGLSEIYFEDKDWEKVYTTNKNLYDLSSAHVEINIAKVTRKMGVAAFNLGKYNEAINALMLSAKKETDVYETSFFLGRAFFEAGVYDKAVICFKKCRLISPDNSETVKYLGKSLFKMQKFKESLPFLKKALDEYPDDKEMLFNMAVAMAESNVNDKALKIFIHLRPDPVFGAQSCLEAGKMHEKSKNYTSAIQDYEIGMKLPNVSPQLILQIKYRCANAYINTNNISKGLVLLKQIQGMHAGYKDVESLIVRYQELNQNKNLQTYLLSGTSDFVALCRKFISAFFKDSFVKVEDVTVASESVEVICSLESNKWESRALFRFYRSQTVIGDIYVREFHSKMRDSKCDNGYCVSMGDFSDSAHKFTEGRPIDLIEKDELCKILKTINMFN